MNIIPAKTPNAIKFLCPEYVWDFYDDNNKILYLTFDDGPIPEVTPFVLDLLKEYKAKATFFCIGENIKKHPEIFQKIINDGHSIGNHTMNHLKAWKSTDEEYINNTLAVEPFLTSYIKTKDKLFRPPYGQISKPKLRKLQREKYKIVLWDVLSKDWDQNTSPKKCSQNVINNSKKGSIIVFHDSLKAYRNLSYSLLEVLKHFSKLGYTFSGI